MSLRGDKKTRGLVGPKPEDASVIRRNGNLGCRPALCVGKYLVNSCPNGLVIVAEKVEQHWHRLGSAFQYGRSEDATWRAERIQHPVRPRSRPGSRGTGTGVRQPLPNLSAPVRRGPPAEIMLAAHLCPQVAAQGGGCQERQ